MRPPTPLKRPAQTRRVTRRQPERVPRPRRSILRNPDFLRLWAGESVSLVGSEVTTLALPLCAVLVLHASALQVSLLSGVVWAPYLLSLVAGVWVDRHRRRPLLIVTNLGRVLTVGIVPLAFVCHWLSFTVLAISAVLTGMLTMLFSLAYGCYLPSLVRAEELIAGNSALQASASVAKLGGPSLAGVLIQVWSAPLALVADALSFLVASASVLTIRRQEAVPRVPPRQSLGNAMRLGLRTTFRQPLMRAMVGMASVYNLGEAAILGLFSSYAVRDLHLAPITIGVVLAVGSAGALLGSLAAHPLVRRWGIGGVWCVATAVSGAAWLLVPLAAGATTLVVLLCAFSANGAGLAVVNICLKTLRAERIPPLLLGRITASYTLCALGVVPLGAVLGGLVQGVIGMRATLGVSAGVSLLSLWWVWKVRQPQRHAWTDAEHVEEPLAA